MLSIGLMSGTSMDGIDAAIIETDGDGHIKELGDTSISYEPPFKLLLKSAEYTVQNCLGDLDKSRSCYFASLKKYLEKELKINVAAIPQKLHELSTYLYGTDNQEIKLNDIITHSTKLHGSIVKKLLAEKEYKANQIDVVGYHGQTLFHRPSIGVTVQVGDGKLLAEDVGITVVNDFRTKDVAAGGQGAPFAPIYHQALAIRDKKIPVAVVNCGGISNITLIKNANEQDLIGYDTGPGNSLIDRFVRQRTQGQEHMDFNGQYGKKGKVDEKILKALYEKSLLVNNQNYFSIKPPKSLDSGDMVLIPEMDALSLEDGCRTLEAFTADTIVNSLNLINAEIPKNWILAGGGWRNPVIRQELEQRLQQKISNAQIQDADEAGWNNQALEAQIFAYLAVRSLENKPISVPGTTRVPHPLSGGTVYRMTMQEDVTNILALNPLRL